jgi:hypothetical protein
MLFSKPDIPEDLYRALIDKLHRKKGDHPVQRLTRQESELIRKIKLETELSNLNNVTRTSAYADFYWENNEIDWAFLAHMVSRNGGWNMTDLAGEFIPRLLNKQDRLAAFCVLERCNWLIFHDAYPQLLLYGESKRQGKNLFHLLPFFGVSSFMSVLWHDFWQRKDAKILTVGLIINEQNVIESRVIKNLSFQQGLQFHLQDLFNLNVVFFPYETKPNDIQLAGVLNQDFVKLKARIKTGKRLYAILFEQKEIHRGVLKWAKGKRHTGSRNDFWPWFFTQEKPEENENYLAQRIKGERISPHAPRIYSPVLQKAWADMTHLPAGGGDWFKNKEMIKHLTMDASHSEPNCTAAYIKALRKLEIMANTRSQLT